MSFSSRKRYFLGGWYPTLAPIPPGYVSGAVGATFDLNCIASCIGNTSKFKYKARVLALLLWLHRSRAKRS